MNFWIKLRDALPFWKKAPAAGETLPPVEKKGQTALRKFWEENRILLLCAVIPAALMLLIYVARKLYPIGDGCVLVLDLNAQYVWFFEALRKAVFGDAGLLYSFSRALGGEFLGIYSYYIASPLSYLVCLFPEGRMLEALLFLFLLKTAICGGTFAYYMKRTLKKPTPSALILFSILYALSAYAVVQQNNTMWIDAVMWLPLITLGIEELIKHGKFRMYTFFLALTLISNFYIGYMVCIYCLVYFFVYYLGHGGSGDANPCNERKHFLKSLGRMAFYSMIAVGIAALLILSTYYSLSFGKSTFSNPDWKLKNNFDILDLLYKFLPGSYDTVRPEGLPFVYCGVLTLLFLPAYFLCKKYPMRQKIASGIFIFFFFVSFSLSLADLVWHGFQAPNWLNYRYSFMLVFFLCVLACRAFAELESIPLRTVAVTGGLIALLCIILQKYDTSKVVKPNDYSCIWFTLLAVFVYLSILGIMRSFRGDKQIVAVFLVTAVCAEVFLCGLWNLNALDDDVVFSTYSRYNGFLEKARPITESVQEADTSFYRMEKTFFRQINDNMALQIRGLSGSTSTLNEETIRFLNKMGYSSQSHWSKYFGGTPVNDSLLGIKYVLSEKDVYGNYYETFLKDEKTGYTAYRNPYALSIAYGVSEDVKYFPLGFVEAEKADETAEPVKTNKEEPEGQFLADFVSGFKEKFNGLLGIDETIRRAEYQDLYKSPFDRLNAIVTAMLGETEKVEIFVPIEVTVTETSNVKHSYVSGGHSGYEPKESNSPAYISYFYTMPTDAEVFFFIPTDYPRPTEISNRPREINYGSESVLGEYNEGYSGGIMSLGMQKAGEKRVTDITLKDKKLYLLTDKPCMYYIDRAVFEDAMSRLAKDQFQIEEYTESSFSGTFTTSKANELVLTTIPFDRGWKVYVDGEETEITKSLGALVSFYINGEPGQTHTLELKYRPKTLLIGGILSGTFLLLFIALVVFRKKMMRIPVLRAVVSIPNSDGDNADKPQADEAEKAELTDANALAFPLDNAEEEGTIVSPEAQDACAADNPRSDVTNGEPADASCSDVTGKDPVSEETDAKQQNERE